jgi:hypothetical protein
MQVVSVKAILKTESNGDRTWVGWAEENTLVPEGLQVCVIPALDLEDNAGTRWLLAESAAVPVLDAAALVALCDGECARTALAKLSDAELTALGLSR